MADSIVNNQQKRDQIELEYDQDILECENIKIIRQIRIQNNNIYWGRELHGLNESNYNKCVTIAQKSKELKLAKLN